MAEPLVLDANNVNVYFRESVLPGLPEGTVLVNSREITEHSFVNWVFAMQVQAPDAVAETIYVRQSRDYVKKYEDMARSMDRVDTEARVLTYLNSIVPGAVPEVINFDRLNFILVLTDIKRGGSHLAEELAEGRVHTETGAGFGRTIGRIQVATFGKSVSELLGEDLPPRSKLGMASYLGSRTKIAQQLFPDQTKKILEDSEAAPRTLVLGDLASKNIFVEGTDQRFLDLERVATGDPAYDLAYLFCHYLIEVPTSALNDSLQYITNFMQTYTEELSKVLNPQELGQLQNRVIRLLGMSIIHRTQGTHFVSYDGSDKDLWQRQAGQMMSNTESTSVIDAITALL